jgi:hypothetical protein
MFRIGFSFALIPFLVLTALSGQQSGPGTSTITETQNGRVVQRTETRGIENPLPLPVNTLEAERSKPIPPSGRLNTSIRWTSFDPIAIGQDVTTNAAGEFTFIGWNLNSMRTSFHDNFSATPLWEHISDPNTYRDFVALSADAAIVANASYHNLYLYDPNSGNITFDFTFEDNRISGPLAVSRDGSLLVCASVSPLFGGTHRVYAFSPPSTTPIWTFDFEDTQSTSVYGVNICADGSTVAVNGKFYGWFLNAEDGSVISEIEIGNTESKLALSGDASVMAIAENNGYVKAYTWDAGTFQYDLLWQYRIPPGLFTNWASSVDLSADGLTLMAGSLIFLSAGNDGSIYLFDTFGDGLPLWVYSGTGDLVDEVVLSDDGSIVAAATWGDLNHTLPDILIFERHSNVPVFTVNSPGSMFSMSMSADGSTVVAGGKSVHARFFGNGGYVYNIGVDLGGGAVSGTVMLDGSPDNAGATVEVLGTPRQATTDATGLYTVENVPAGTYTVRFSRLGYVATTVGGVVVTDGNTTMGVDATLFATGLPPTSLMASHSLDSRVELNWTLPTDAERRAFDRQLAADPITAWTDKATLSATGGNSNRLDNTPAFDAGGTPDSIRVYRATRSGGPYLMQATLDGTSTMYTDEAVFPLRDYYYTVTAIYGDGESVYSNEAFGTVDSSFLQFSITAPHRTVVPSIDGAISPGEWDDALQVDISDVFGYGGGIPLERGSVFMYFKYDSTTGTLYVAGEDFLNNDALTDAEGFGLYFDDNNDNQFEPIGAEPLTREGNYWAYWFGSGPLVRFREIYTGGGVTSVIDTVWDAGVAASVSTGHFVGEVSIPISFFDKNHLQVFGPDKKVGAGLFMINRLAGTAVFHGWWPQTMNSVFTPSGFGDIEIPITLLAPPTAPTDVTVEKQGDDLLVTWTDPTTGINGDPLTVPVSLQLVRNGVDVGELPTGVGSYQDTDVAPMGWYEYKLRGFIDVVTETEYYGPYSETVGNFAVQDPVLSEIRYDDGIPETFYVVDFVYNENKFGIRFTPSDYPATVYRVEAFTNNANSPILVSIYDDEGGLPGTILTGEYPGVTHQLGGVDSFTVTIPATDPPTINAGDFWVVLSYLPTSPGAPGIGGDLSNPIDGRSWYYTAGSGWLQLTTVDLIVRASVTGGTVGVDDPEQVPQRYALYQNFPNPFNPESRVRFDLPEQSRVTLVVYNLLGQEVARVLDEEMEAGAHSARIDARSLSSGVYFYRLQAGHFVESRKMVVLK